MPENGRFISDRNLLDASIFYDEVSEEYDEMTELVSRVKNEREIFEKIVSEYSIKNCLDAGCGTGVHSIILSLLGVDAYGIDISPKMIEKAMGNATRFNTSPKFSVMNFTQIKDNFREFFDCVICLGNTLPHLISEKELLSALRNFYIALKQNGVLIIQILNYDRILENEERIISVRESEKKIFVRFYDFEPTIIGSPSLKVFEIRRDFLRFNILIADKTQNYACKLISTRIKPLKSEDLCKKLSMVGFKKTEVFGTLKKEVFKSDSKNLVIFATK